MAENGDAVCFFLLHLKTQLGIPSLKLTFSHLEIDGWKTIVSFLDGLFSGAMLDLGRVYIYVCVCALPETDIFAPEKMIS